MKKLFLFLALGAMVVSCSPDDKGGCLDDGKTRVTLDFEGAYWDALIDNPQYNGELLYKQEGYSWYDEATDLYSIVNELWYTSAYWNGGLATPLLHPLWSNLPYLPKGLIRATTVSCRTAISVI